MVLQPAGGTSNAKEASSLEDFLKPVPTYSGFISLPRDMDTQRYGLSATRHATLLRDGVQAGY